MLLSSPVSDFVSRPLPKPSSRFARPMVSGRQVAPSSFRPVFGNQPNTKSRLKIDPSRNSSSNVVVDLGKLGVVIAVLGALGPFVGLSVASMLSLPALVFGLVIPTVIDLFSKKKDGPVAWAHRQFLGVADKGIEFIRKRRWINWLVVGKGRTADKWAQEMRNSLHLERLAKHAELKAKQQGGTGAFSWGEFKGVIQESWNLDDESKINGIGIGILSTSAYMFRLIRKSNSFQNMKEPLRLVKQRRWWQAVRLLWQQGRGLKSFISFRFWKAIMIGVLLGSLGEAVSRITLAALYKREPVLSKEKHIS